MGNMKSPRTRNHAWRGRWLALVAAALALPAAASLPHFPPGAVWRENITHAPVAPESASMIQTLSSLGGWGHGHMQIDFALTVLHATPLAPTRKLIAGDTYYRPDCDDPGFQIPLPIGGAIEDSPSGDYHCDPSAGDCHLLVAQGDKLYESYGSNLTDAGLESTCAVVWDLGRIYPARGRGEGCTSADAAGFPIAPLLIDADEVAAAVLTNGDLGHALRLVLPNARMASDAYVHPATHFGGPSGPASTVPYGARLRLRPDFPMAGYDPAARVILRTMQHYGLVVADGGNIALTAANDRYSVAKWGDLGIDSHTFYESGQPVEVTDFDVIDTGPRLHNDDCQRTAADFLMINGFEF